MRLRASATVAAVAVALVAAFAGGVHADTGVLPNTDALPWIDPNHLSPLEQLANQVASTIAKRPVRVYCDGDNDWAQLAAHEGFDPNAFSSWVVYQYWSDTQTIVADANIAHMPPRICQALWTFGKATQKPTKCATTVTQTRTVVQTIRVAKRVRVRVKVAGHWKYVWRTRRVPKRVVRHVTQEVPGPPAPCYETGILKPSVPPEYGPTVRALFELGRDGALMADLRAGLPAFGPYDSHSTCIGLQQVPYIASAFGASPDDARSIAAYADDAIYAHWSGSSSWSADCHENGPLDQTPGDGIWP